MKKKGKITNLSKKLSTFEKKDRPKVGEKINELKLLFNELNDKTSLKIEKKELEIEISKEQVDVSLPVDTSQRGDYTRLQEQLKKYPRTFN